MSVTATFTRNSTAYKEDGTPVRAGVPRFEEGKFGKGVLIEEGTTNLADSNAFSVYSGAAATRSVQVGGPYDGWYRVDATAANPNNRYIAYNISAPAIAHGETRTLSLEFVSESGNVTPFMDGSGAVAALALVPGTNRWVKTWTNTLGVLKMEGVYFKSATGGAISETFYYRFYMQEAKPYATSFVDGTRSAETLTFPTAGVLNPQEGTVELTYIPFLDSSKVALGGATQDWWWILGAGSAESSDELRLAYTNGAWHVRVGGSSDTTYTASFAAGDKISLTLAWKQGVGARFFINGVKVATFTPSNFNVGTIVSIGYSYLWNGYRCNGLIDDLRIDNIARSDAEILAAYQSGQPLQRDQYTTCLLTFDGTLRDKTRQFEVLSNTPSTGYISWSDLNIGYKGIFYNVADGSTNKKFAWWDYTQPYVLQTGDEVPVLTNDDVLVFFNKNGAAVTVPMATVVDGSLIVPESIVADAIAANTITGEKIAANTISADNIAANAVTADKVAANAIGAAAIAAGAVATEKLAANAVTSEKIYAGAVTTEKIGAKAVTAEKINVESLSAISSDIGHITAGQIDAGVIRVGANTQFEAGYDPTKVASMGVDADCLGLWHFDGSLNSHKGVPVESNADYNAGLFGQALNIATGKHLKVPAAGMSASQGTINFRAKNLSASSNGSVLIDLPDSTNTEGLRVGISGDGKIYVEKIMDWGDPDDFSQTEIDFSTGALTQVWQAHGGLQLDTTTMRTWNDFTGTSWNDLA